MDGILDLNQISTIREIESDRFYAISLRMWDGKKHVLAAETETVRNSWIQALQYASNLWSSASKEDFICTEIILPEHSFHHYDRSERLSSPSSLLSSSYAEENHQELSSYSSDDQSEYFSLVDEDEISDLSSSPRTLPPSPPINRNVISLVKEKSRTRCNHGSKTHSSLNGCMDTCDYNSNRNPENLQDQNTYSKVDENDENNGILFDEHLINEEFETMSPITPPAEFMNCTLNGVLGAETNSASGSSQDFLKKCRMCSTLRSKLVSAQEEIKKLEKELREAHANFDNLEMFSYKLTQDMKLKEENYNSQIALMTAKIDDLTSKFTFSEKNYRQLKQKTQKTEGKERRRSSLKNKEGLSLTKEYETKLCDLEKKVNSIETSIKRDPSEIDESERSVSECSSKLSESFFPTSESSENNTPSEQPSSENKGFFSRLQSLISRVESVNSVFSIKDDSNKILENPKIFLQVKNNEGLGSFDESDEWQIQASNDVQTHTTDLFSDYPKTLSECQNMLSQKLNCHFEWLKQSLELIYVRNKVNSESQNEQLTLINNLTQELKDLQEEVSLSSLTEQKALMLFEITKILEYLYNYESTGTALKTNAVKNTFKTIFQTLCIALSEYEYSDFSHLLISSIPQFNYFCPSANKLFTERLEDLSHLNNITERLQLLEDQSRDILSSFSEAKVERYESLWNILADVPVQDDPINKPSEMNSISTCTISIATNIHKIAEFQLSNVPKTTNCLTQFEEKSMQEWYELCHENLNYNLRNFLDELKAKCPMISENTISFYKLNESTRNDIISLVVELSFLNVCHSLLKFLVEYLSSTNQLNEVPTQNYFLLHEKWLSFIETSHTSKNIVTLENTFQCSQCAMLNSLLEESGQHIDWLNFVQKYNDCNFRKINDNLKVDLLKTLNSSNNLCSNCESKLPIVPGIGQKDVCNNVTCSQCDSWIQKFCTSEKQHELEQITIEIKHNAELKQLEECIIKSSEMHEQEMLQKQNELATVTTQLQRIKTEYEEQKQILQNFYEEKLNFECDSINEDSIKDIYRIEIEDLKGMFKEGLIAIENSHNRITSEMEKRHKEEILLLEAEKEKALEIEAQATITALEAIKKSHSQQLQEETALIRKELMNKFKKSEECENLYNKYGKDLEKLREEILKITEMYSTKCLENVALEEKINSLRQQLKEANKELSNLLCKNREINSSLCVK